VALLQYPLGLRTNKRVFPPLASSKNNPENQLAVNGKSDLSPTSDVLVSFVWVNLNLGHASLPSLLLTFGVAWL